MSKTTDKVIDLKEKDLTASVNGSKKKSQFPTYKAIALFQHECPVIHKATKGYGYTYADLASIFKIIMPLMAKHKLGFMQPIEGKSLKTVIFYYGDEYALPIESSADIPQGVQLKGMYGSALTYFRRYTLASNLGIITDKDIDASGEQEIVKTDPIFLPVLEPERFGDAIESIENGDYSIDRLIQEFNLSFAQETVINKLKTKLKTKK